MKTVGPIAGTIYFKKFIDFDFQLTRAYAYDADFGPAFGLCIATAMKIAEGDFENWYTEWKSAGDKLLSSAENSEKNGYPESSKRDYLAASVCYRNADFFIRQNLEDIRLVPLADMQRDSLRKGFSKFDFGLSILNIPYQNTTLDGYLFTSDKSGKPKPTLIYIGGYDSFVEETFYSGSYQALLRGYNVLAYDGPGQGQVLRRQKLYFRPDWENVSSPVLDYAETLPEIDKTKIVLFGRSFSGYLAPRAACFDKRPCALVADAALYDLGAMVKRMIPPDIYKLLTQKKFDEVNKYFESFLADSQKKFYFTSRMSTHGAKSVAEYMYMLIEYSLEGISKNINIPAYISCGEFDTAAAEQSELLYNNVSSSDKILVKFKGDDGAGEHCEFANQNIFYSSVFNWLDERFNKN